MNFSDFKFIVVIPVYNEQDIIQRVIEDVKLKLSEYDYQILILNDGSKDKTKEKLKIFENDRKISIINKDNEGHGKTLIRGYNLAIKKRCDFIVQIDSDDQIPLEELFKIIQNSKDYDLISGYRYKRNDPLIRILTTNILKLLILLRHRIFIRDSNIPFRIMSRSFLEKNLSKVENSDVPNILLSILAAKKYKFKQIETIHKERSTGEISIKRFKLFIFCLKTFFTVLKFKIT